MKGKKNKKEERKNIGKSSATQLMFNLNENSIFENQLVWNYGDTARHLGCGIRHVKTLVSEDQIPFSRLGRLVRFSPIKVSEWFLKGGTR
jgi:excisionase family DNA binding protein